VTVRVLVLVMALAASSCAADRPGSDAETLAPRGPTPGRRLPWPEASSVSDWAFAAGEDEIALETQGRRGRHSVTVWSVVVDGRLYVATDGRGRKRWVTQIDGNPDARVGIRGKTYAVRARPVRDQKQWDAVMRAYAQKYGGQLARYEFPKAGDLRSGHVFELASRR
jgi:hypothetical protein